MKDVKIITIESDFGAGKKGAKFGPEALLKKISSSGPDILKHAEVRRILSEDRETNAEHPFLKNIEVVLDIQQKAVETIDDVLLNKALPFIISGDHSNGAAGISAVKNHYPDKRLGVIWVDAHADIHNPFSTPSGNLHGMPLAVVLGLKHEVEDKNEVTEKELVLWQSLLELGDKKISPKIDFSDLVYIELRDYEEDEMDTINKHGIKYFSPRQRREEGIEKILKDSLKHLEHCDLIYLSFDVDSLDPEISIGTGTPVPDGLSKPEAVYLLKKVIAHPKTVAFEITEINPLLDRNHPMEEVAFEILTEALV